MFVNKRHWARECPEVVRYKKFQKDKKSTKDSKDKKIVITIDNDEEPSVFCFEEIMAAKQSKQLHPNDILCDNQASFSIFHNRKLVSNIRKAKREIILRGVGGNLAVDLEADVKGFGKVFFHPESIANILCFYDLANISCMTTTRTNSWCLRQARKLISNLKESFMCIERLHRL